MHTPRKAGKQLTQVSLHRHALDSAQVPIMRETMVPEENIDEFPNLADEPVYFHADRSHHVQPGDTCEEDVEHAEAEITELFRCAGRL
jgi:hypothetical protein